MKTPEQIIAEIVPIWIADGKAFPVTKQRHITVGRSPLSMMHHFVFFRVAIQAALDDPRRLVPHAEVTAQFAKLRSDALRKVE